MRNQLKLTTKLQYKHLTRAAEGQYLLKHYIKNTQSESRNGERKEVGSRLHSPSALVQGSQLSCFRWRQGHME